MFAEERVAKRETYSVFLIKVYNERESKHPKAGKIMSETPTELCRKCGAEIDPTRRVDFTLKNGTKVCEQCFVKDTPRQTQAKNDWAN